MNNKYLKADDFVIYSKSLNVDVSEYVLEKYEKIGLLYPAYRIVKPREYVNESFINWHTDPVNYRISNKYSEIDRLLNSIMPFYHKPIYYNIALKHGHPLDYYFAKRCKYILKPNKSNFKPWKDYDIYIKLVIPFGLCQRVTA